MPLDIKPLLKHARIFMCLVLVVAGATLVLFGIFKPASHFPFIKGPNIHPNALAVVLGIVFIPVGLFLARYAEQISFTGYPQLEGDYEYRCIDLAAPTGEKLGYRHGGTCRIAVHPTKFGVQWELNGERRWAANEQSKYRDRLLHPHLLWNTSWGSITGDNELKYEYSVETQEGMIRGYATGTITMGHSDKQVVRVTGHFYQLPPLHPMQGNFEFRRLEVPDDFRWMPADSEDQA